jgi:glycine oxidase
MAADVVIAGAGIIGASIAWRLAQAGMRVALLDAGRMGGEASWAGAGMLAPGGEIESRSAWSEMALDSLAMYGDFVAELESESGIEIDFARAGALELAFTDKDRDEVERRAVEREKLGIRSERVAEGRFYPDDALVNPRDVMSALRAACVARGVEIQEGKPVLRIEAGSGGVRVDGREAAFAVLAAGAWSSRIECSHPLPRAYPVRGHLVGYRMPPESVPSILRHAETYILQRRTGFTIAGSSIEHVGFDRTPDAAIAAGIRERAARLLPALAGVEPAESWLGFRPAVEGDTPAIGAVGDTALWLAYGHYRNGILLAPATARKIAAGITASSGTARS